MREPSVPKLAKWPFLLGDGLMVGAVLFIYFQTPTPMSARELAIAAACLALGAIFALLPFVLEYRASSRVAEAGALESVVTQIKSVESIAAQISAATANWQTVQDSAEKTVRSSREIAERMTGEVKGFAEFMQNINDREKSTLKLEVEKMRRAEAEWLQVIVRLLDHVFALYQGAVRSGQANVINQVSNFQNACRDAARRIGLVPFAAEASEPFNPERHQTMDGEAKPSPDARIADTLATGFTFQGRLLRPALVRLIDGQPSTTPEQHELPIDADAPTAR